MFGGWMMEVSLFTKIENQDDFADWCYYNGIYWFPSQGSKIGAKLGLTDADLNRAHRFDIVFQLGRFSDWLLKSQIPALALLSINISNLQYLYLRIMFPNPFTTDLELDE
jgi:hypothetical protein